MTRAVLKEVGKLPSESERFINLVTGRRRASIQDLRSFVGKTSRGQVEFDEERIACRTSSGVAGRKFDRRGGGETGEGLRF